MTFHCFSDKAIAPYDDSIDDEKTQRSSTIPKYEFNVKPIFYLNKRSRGPRPFSHSIKSKNQAKEIKISNEKDTIKWSNNLTVQWSISWAIGQSFARSYSVLLVLRENEFYKLTCGIWMIVVVSAMQYYYVRMYNNKM